MKIILQPTQRRGFTLRFPTRLTLNGFTAFLLSRYLRKKVGKKVLPARYFRRLFRAVLKERKRLGSAWELATIETRRDLRITILP